MTFSLQFPTVGQRFSMTYPLCIIRSPFGVILWLLSMAFKGRSFISLLDRVYPFRIGLLANLYSISVLEVVNFCIAINLQLSKAEEDQFLDPAKRVIAEIPNWACQHGSRPSSCIFIGKDLYKPKMRLRHGRSKHWSEDTIRLVLILGCPIVYVSVS